KHPALKDNLPGRGLFALRLQVSCSSSERGGGSGHCPLKYVLEKLCFAGPPAQKGRIRAHSSGVLGLAFPAHVLLIQDAVLATLPPRNLQFGLVLLRASKQLSGLVADGDEYLGWKHVLHGNLDVCEVPGHQQNMLLEPMLR